jgi:enamine deaminase RidA (YjgF/YER057c/UK114 family)
MNKKSINIPTFPAPDAYFLRALKATMVSTELLFISGAASVRQNKVRAAVFAENGLKREYFPASTAVQAKLCRKDLLIEMEAIAVKANHCGPAKLVQNT